MELSRNKGQTSSGFFLHHRGTGDSIDSSTKRETCETFEIFIPRYNTNWLVSTSSLVLSSTIFFTLCPIIWSWILHETNQVPRILNKTKWRMVIVSRAEVKGKEFVHGLNDLIDGSDRPREKGKSWFSDPFSEFCSCESLLRDLYVLPWYFFNVEFEVLRVVKSPRFLLFLNLQYFIRCKFLDWHRFVKMY